MLKISELQINKTGIYIFLFLSFLIGSFVIIHLIKIDIEDREKLEKHKMIETRNNLNSRALIDRTYKGYIYITLSDGSKYIIGPTKELTSDKKIFDLFYSGDSLIKLSDSDTLTIISKSKYKRPEKFLLN